MLRLTCLYVQYQVLGILEREFAKRIQYQEKTIKTSRNLNMFLTD